MLLLDSIGVMNSSAITIHELLFQSARKGDVTSVLRYLQEGADPKR
jgi:hypothetical protein